MIEMWQKQIDKPLPFRPVTILLKDGNQVDGHFKDANEVSGRRGWYAYGLLINWEDVAGWQYQNSVSRFLSH
jgi:hypothetical protein